MTIQLTPEQERVLQDAIESGFVRSVDEFIGAAIAMLAQAKSRTDAVRRPEDANPDSELLRRSQEFFANKSFSELAEAQGVKPLNDPSILIGGWPEDEDVDEFLEATYRERNASLLHSPNERTPA